MNQTKQQIIFFIKIFISAFLINLIWENLHAGLYFLPSGEPITQFILLRSTFFDAVFILILSIFFIKIPYLRERKWLAIIFGMIFSIIVEKHAIEVGRWAYNSFMPIIPLLKTGLTPTIQLGVLSYLILKVFDRNK